MYIMKTKFVLKSQIKITKNLKSVPNCSAYIFGPIDIMVIEKNDSLALSVSLSMFTYSLCIFIYVYLLYLYLYPCLFTSSICICIHVYLLYLYLIKDCIQSLVCSCKKRSVSNAYFYP